MEDISCPICFRDFPANQINVHVEKCLFLHSSEKEMRCNVELKSEINAPSNPSKKPKLRGTEIECIAGESKKPKNLNNETPSTSRRDSAPLAEQMRPNMLEEYVGQNHVLGWDKMLRQLLFNKDIPSMIFWGPPGCGKTSLANVISNACKNEDSLRFVKVSATMSGINDIKEIVKVAKNECKYKKKTVLFMDEIHRFNKLQQDTFLPHIENGTFILIGATTENPSFSLNSALLSRCRVIVLEKLSVEDIVTILLRAAKFKNIFVCDENSPLNNTQETNRPGVSIDQKTIKWLAEICDGDARIALNSFQLAIHSKDTSSHHGDHLISLEDVKDGIKRSHILYDRKGEEHYNIISALHKAVRASDDNASLYWLTRMIVGGEDPLYIARRLVRIAGEDVGLADPNAINIAVSCMQGCQLLRMPECDVLLAECTVYLARAPKSTQVYQALQRCKENINQYKGPLPGVPLHLRNAPTKLMSQLGYGHGYNTKNKEESGLTYMPEGMGNLDFFQDINK